MSLARGGYIVDSTVQVHAGAPVNLLLGSDVHRQLGLAVLALQHSYPVERHGNMG